MPQAGQIIRAADFDGYATDEDTTDETNFNTTTYSLGGTTVGTSFRAPTSGSVEIKWVARPRLVTGTAVRILVSAEVRTGATPGSGTQINAANDDSALEIGEATGTRLGAACVRVVTGLTAGTTYNVSLWHRNATSVASAGAIQYRAVYVSPWLG
jgi:hypothetical protein